MYRQAKILFGILMILLVLKEYQLAFRINLAQNVDDPNRELPFSSRALASSLSHSTASMAVVENISPSDNGPASNKKIRLQHVNRPMASSPPTLDNSSTFSAATGNSSIQINNINYTQSNDNFNPYKNKSRNQPSIDIVSVYSAKEAGLLDAQKRSFGSHPSIRSFYAFSEKDDHEMNCHTDLTKSSWTFVTEFCRNQETDRDEVLRFRERYASARWLSQKGDDDAIRGWLCAQKRPAESLHKVLNGYNKTTLPDYLILVDADSYLNFDKILNDQSPEALQTAHPPSKTSVVAGCLIRENVVKHNFTFPWGGFGTIFTKTTLERFIEPISNCGIFRFNAKNNQTFRIAPTTDPLWDEQTNSSLKLITHREHTYDEFQRLVCAQLREDAIGEAFLFREGMSLSDLMYAYVTHWNYTHAETTWKTHPEAARKGWRNIRRKRPKAPVFVPGGFCLHADWVVGYFVNRYYLSSHDPSGDGLFADNPKNRMRGYHGAEHYAGRPTKRNEEARQHCLNDGDQNCNVTTAHVCHHVTAGKMLEAAAM